jgi:hypothetical protein
MKIKIRLILDLGNAQLWSCHYVLGLVNLGYCFGVFKGERLIDAYLMTRNGVGVLNSWLFHRAYGSAREFNRD